jgi:hypothetical protein
MARGRPGEARRPRREGRAQFSSPARPGSKRGPVRVALNPAVQGAGRDGGGETRPVPGLDGPGPGGAFWRPQKGAGSGGGGGGGGGRRGLPWLLTHRTDCCLPSQLPAGTDFCLDFRLPSQLPAGSIVHPGSPFGSTRAPDRRGHGAMRRPSSGPGAPRGTAAASGRAARRRLLRKPSRPSAPCRPFSTGHDPPSQHPARPVCRRLSRTADFLPVHHPAGTLWPARRFPSPPSTACIPTWAGPSSRLGRAGPGQATTRWAGPSSRLGRAGPGQATTRLQILPGT